MINPSMAINKKKRGHNTEYAFLCRGCGREIWRRGCYLSKNDSPGYCHTCGNRKIWSCKLQPFEHILTYLKRQNHPVFLSYEELLEFTHIETCEYCGSLVSWESRKSFKRCTHATNLDRKNNSLGYSKDNCVVYCWECNRVRGNVYSYYEMKKIGKLLKILKNSKKSSNNKGECNEQYGG